MIVITVCFKFINFSFQIFLLFVPEEVIRDTANKQSRKSVLGSDHCCASPLGRNVGSRYSARNSTELYLILYDLSKTSSPRNYNFIL
jgi:hypothetical protein